VTTGLVYELLKKSQFSELTKDLKLREDSKVLVISTEGDTDPGYYRKVVW
jgi:diaminopropionate ammonia-lyase